MKKPGRNRNYAAFIMTYERPRELKQTIQKLIKQSLPPEYLLVIDNSTSTETQEMMEELTSPTIGFYKMGYNAGPAGAAKMGLEKLASMGFDWIYWGDDDDPPQDDLEIEYLFGGIIYLQEKGIQAGMIGGKGGRFNTLTGRIKSLSNQQLREGPCVEVDSVPGGHSMLVNSEVVKAGVLPDEKLFFGFEEFDFCLRIKSNGFKIFIRTEKWLKERVKTGNTDPHYRWKGSSFGKTEKVWRGYYSTRNLLEIYRKNHFFSAFLFLLIKSVLKMGLGFRYGSDYGRKGFRAQVMALYDFFNGKFGRKGNLV